MNILIYAIYIYLTYYTFSYGRVIWRSGNKPGAIATYVLAASLLPLVIALLVIK